MADRVAGYFVTIVLLCAVCVAWYWWQTGTSNWLTVTISVLIITCPCALSLATPAAITSFVSSLAGQGAIVARGHAAETLARATHVVFDKTGTLTDGDLSLHEVELFGAFKRDEVLAIAAALEINASHPIATAIRREASDSTTVASSITQSAGGGVQGIVNGVRWYLGTPEYLRNNSSVAIAEQCSALADQGYSQAWLASDAALVAVFYFADEVRDDARELVEHLRQSGRTVSILSGDCETAVARAAQDVGIDNYRYRLTPDQKCEHIKQLQSGAEIVAMIGDGVNDSAALACADVSIAMADGADIAKNHADVILINDRLGIVRNVFSLAVRTLAIIRQNLLWAIGYNVLALPFAALGYVAPWMAAIGMSASSLIVVLNATRLRGR